MSCLIYIKEHSELYTKRIKEIFASFVAETTEDLFSTWEEANEYVLNDDVINKYIGGELGTNELLFHRVLLFNEFDDICNLMFHSVIGTLKQKNLLTNAIENYLLDLKRFIFMRKKDFLTKTGKTTKATFKHDFEAIKSQYCSVVRSPTFRFLYFLGYDSPMRISSQRFACNFSIDFAT